MNSSKNFVVSIPVVVRALGITIGLLLFASTALQVMKYMSGGTHGARIARLFYVDEEANFPTYFSTFQLLLAAVLLAVIARLEHRRMAPLARYWTVLAAVFFAMSVDELCSLHEMTMAPMRVLLGGKHLGVFYYAWVIPAMVVLAGLGLYFVRFLWLLPRAVSFRFLIAAVIFVSGAVAIELLEGSYAEEHGRETLTWVAYVTVEEFLEMSGVLLFVHTLLQYISTNYSTLTVTVAEKSTAGSLAKGT